MQDNQFCPLLQSVTQRQTRSHEQIIHYKIAESVFSKFVRELEDQLKLIEENTGVLIEDCPLEINQLDIKMTEALVNFKMIIAALYANQTY